MEKYHQFVYGRDIIIETDHKPLVTIVNKDLSKISARLQRMVLKLLKYNFTIKYVPGEKMFIADYLSRNFVLENAKEEPTLKELVHTIEQEIVYGLECDLPISDTKLQQFQTETELDSDLKQI